MRSPWLGLPGLTGGVGGAGGVAGSTVGGSAGGVALVVGVGAGSAGVLLVVTVGMGSSPSNGRQVGHHLLAIVGASRRREIPPPGAIFKLFIELSDLVVNRD